jgi:hypothetical protein
MLNKSSLSLGIAAAIALTGCGGGGSSASTGDETASGETTVVSGRAADGYLSQARVFIDLNNNGSLDSDEPRTTTDGSGFFSLETESVAGNIIVEAIKNLTVDLDTNQPVPNGFTLRSPIIEGQQEQFVSPITTMVVDELENDATLTLEQAKARIADRLDTSIDVMSDFIAAKENGDETTRQNAERLHRVAQVTARIAAQIEAQTDQSDLDTLGITKQEFMELVAQQIEVLIPLLLIDIDNSLGDETFDPDQIVDNGDYDITPPGEEPPTNEPVDPLEDFPELEQRLAAATADSPFLTWNNGTPEANFEGSTNYLKFEPVGNGKAIYEGVQKVVQYGETDFAAVAGQEFFPRFDTSGVTTEKGFISADNSNVFIYMNGQWNGETVEDNLIGFKQVTSIKSSFSGFEPSEKGTEGSSAYNGHIMSDATYARFDLSGISIRDTLVGLYPELAGVLSEQTDPTVFSDGATGYLRDETLAMDLFMIDWRGGLGFSGCDSSYTNLELKNCNVVYGASTDPTVGPNEANPAQTLDGLMYPADIADEDINAVIGFENNGKSYFMTLHGNKSDGSGEIRIGETGSGDKNPVATGTWELMQYGFEHIKLNMPDGFYYRAFQKTRGDLDFNSYAFLTEFKGYVRAGRFAQVGTSVPGFFKRDENAPLLDNQARDEALAKLNEWGVLTGHPGWEEQD